MMGLALNEGSKALNSREVPIGCVVAAESNGVYRVLARAHNRTNESYNPTLHAEIVLLNDLIAGLTNGGPPAGSVEERLQTILANCTLFVTVEPCIMCADALCKVGIKKVVYGCPNEKFGGCGTVLDVTEGRAKVKHGLRAEEAVALLKQFYARANLRAPAPSEKKCSLSSPEGSLTTFP